MQSKLIVRIRPATLSDLPAIDNIYNQAIVSEFTAHTKPLSKTQRLDWFNNHKKSGCPLLIAECDHETAGWLSFAQYRSGRQALSKTAEISYYVNEAFHGRGIGSQLIQHALHVASGYKFKVLLAIILEHNPISIYLLEKYGFEKWGFLPAVADFNGKLRAQFYYGKIL
ncbi:MAG TPA: N-acetyltransferase family protein [Bacteroidales bacterium]|nr:N-acetyltransferase family protein [Bacteroidales bacterium]